MNTKELVINGDLHNKVIAVCCGKCGTVFGPEHRNLADKCCDRKCFKCGVSVGKKYTTICDECFKKSQEKKEQARFDKAKKVKYYDYDGDVFFLDDYMFGDKEELEEHLMDTVLDSQYLDNNREGETITLPEYVWAAKRVELKNSIHPFDILDNIEDKYYRGVHFEEEMKISWVDEQEFIEFILRWGDKQNYYYYEIDYSRAIIF